MLDFTQQSATTVTNVNIGLDVSQFKGLNKTIVIITGTGQYTISTQQLWNNSGKPRTLTIKNGNISVSNNK